jgi:hypothetical protein
MSTVTSPKESSRSVVESSSTGPAKNEVKKKDSRLEWTEQIESLLSGWADTAAVYKWLHDKSHRKYKAKNKWLAVPTSILSIVTGSLSIGLQGYVPAEYMSIGQGALGGLGIFIGILQGLQTQFGWAQRSERHASSCLGWGKLHRNISIELAVEQEFRKDCDSFVKVCRMEYDRLTEQSPAIPSDVLELFKKTFKNEDKTEGKTEESEENEDDKLILPDICDSIKHTKVYRAGITNPDSIVKNVYDIGKSPSGDDKDKEEAEKFVNSTLMKRIKALDEKLSPINKLKAEEINNRYYRAESSIKGHLDDIDHQIIPRKSFSHTHHQTHLPYIPIKQPPPISGERKKTVVNEFQGISQILTQSLNKPQLGLQPRPHRPQPIDLGYQKPNVKNLINMFNPHGNKDKVEIVVDNPLVNDELKEIDTEKEEDTDKEQTTPVQEIKPMNVEIPKLNLDNVVEDEMKRQNGGNVNTNNANINSSKRGVKIVFSDDESDN